MKLALSESLKAERAGHVPLFAVLFNLLSFLKAIHLSG
jgi:hypothetical protein